MCLLNTKSLRSSKRGTYSRTSHREHYYVGHVITVWNHVKIYKRTQSTHQYSCLFLFGKGNSCVGREFILCCKSYLFYVTSVVCLYSIGRFTSYEVLNIFVCMGTSTSRRMDDSDSRSRSDDSSDQDSDLATILQYLIRRLVVGEWCFIP